MTDDFGDFGDFKEFWSTDGEECPLCNAHITMAFKSTKTEDYICGDCISKEDIKN
ncbi:MAG: hypothetical protein KJI69_03560 [Patescibacteria group bacterium]|nr:hypothetical protein [Patescibacteria group bacterium]